MRKHEVISKVLQMAFPPRCAVCDGLLLPEEIKNGIHVDCRKRLYPVRELFCMHCGCPLDGSGREYCDDCRRRLGQQQNPYWNGKPVSYIVQGRGVFEYRGMIKKTMYRFKYANRREYADFLAKEACERWGGWIRQMGSEAIVPFPMYRRKERHRGYNQAALFGAALSVCMELPCIPEAIRRVKKTRPQKLLNDIERKNNLKNAFQAMEFIVQYKKILVVDDIYTTGSTVEAVAEELNRAGVKQVFFLTACIGKGF